MTEQTVLSSGMAARARPEIIAMKGYASARSLVETAGSTVSVSYTHLTLPTSPHV